MRLSASMSYGKDKGKVKKLKKYVYFHQIYG